MVVSGRSVLSPVQTFPCFLHGLNSMIGEICSHPWMKRHVTKATRIATFFNGSHYWGGQLKDQAKRDNITHTLKQNCESRWYALILQAVSVKEHRWGSGNVYYVKSPNYLSIY